MITYDLKPGLRGMLKKKKALVKIREAVWFEIDVAIKYPSFSVICFPTVDMPFIKMVSRLIYDETANIYVETDVRWGKKEYNCVRVTDSKAN